MTAFVATAAAIYEYTPGAGSFTASVARPGGSIASGDTIFFLMSIENSQTGTVTLDEGQTQIGTWQTGEADAYDTLAVGLFSVVWDGVNAAYDFSFTKDATRGGGIYCWAYTGDCTVQSITYDFDTAAAGSRNGAAFSPATGNLGLAFTCSGATTLGVTWGGGFTERGDDEYYGNMSLGEIAGDGTAKTPSITPAASTQTVWIELDVGEYGVALPSDTPFPPLGRGATW